MACEACDIVFPELTHFGRVFKANGYVLTNLKQVRDVTGKNEERLELSQTPALSIMFRRSDPTYLCTPVRGDQRGRVAARGGRDQCLGQQYAVLSAVVCVLRFAHAHHRHGP
jgi:hypothetical protein